MSYPNTHTPTRAEVKGKAKYQVPMLPGKGNVLTYTLTDDIKEKFIELFPKTLNRDMMRLFGISFVTLQRFKRQLGLTKDKKVIIRKQAQITKKICEENGYYDSLRGKPVSEQCRKANIEWRKTHHPILIVKATNPRRYRRLMARRSQKRKELIESERKRVWLGLTPKSNMPNAMIGAVRKYDRHEVYVRNRAVTKGYAVGYPFGDERYCLFYNDNTIRGEIFERNAIRIGFKILADENEQIQQADL